MTLAVKLRGSSTCRFMAIMLSILGVGAIGLGGQELWAGFPLIKNKMAKEDRSLEARGSESCSMDPRPGGIARTCTAVEAL